MNPVESLIKTIAARVPHRTEATLQADIRQLLLTAPLDLDPSDLEDVPLESQVGSGRRIDIEIAACVIEVKKDLRKGNVAREAIDQLAGYVKSREETTGCRYVGILTDGAEWRCFQVTAGSPKEVSSIALAATTPDIDSFLIWLDGVLATAKDIPPTPAEIGRRLGAGSSPYSLDRSTLSELFRQHKTHHAVLMKRQLWARLLTTALGAQFRDDDDLFVEHTLLVNSAEIIAHAVLGLDVHNINPAFLVSGAKFEESGIHGVVEADFFDWVVHVPEGESFIRILARRLGRFDWGMVKHDVLKVLYESVISADTRKRLGEYYTPDWLAEKMIDKAVLEPLKQHVLDPACGSGTFLFYAVRKYLEAAAGAKHDLKSTLGGLTTHVIGMDLHPVAVTLARVTYLLSIGRERLSDPKRGEIYVPVYLGDSLQWKHEDPNLFSAGDLIIKTNDGRELFDSELRFPDILLSDPIRFDQIVHELAEKASTREPGSAIPSLSSIFRRVAVEESARPTLTETFRAMCRLHDEGRDHIWGYYVRNLARPVWLARQHNRVDVLVGNPPWLAYRHMTPEMQVAFREMSEERNLWHGATVATHQDLSGLFIALAIELYLKLDGSFAMIVPNAAVDRRYFEGLREGVYRLHSEQQKTVYASFDVPWDLKAIRPHFFPRGSAVLFGRRASKRHTFPKSVEVWKGKLPQTTKSWADAEPHLKHMEQLPSGSTEENSPYRERFTQGAILAPRLVFIVEARDTGSLGVPAGKLSIKSCRGANEKSPWKQLPGQEGIIESEFFRPVYTGETLLPYRTLTSLSTVLPVDKSGLLSDEQIEMFPGLQDWWSRSEACWKKYRSSKKLDLRQQLDFHAKLSKQFPVSRQRIVYNKSGMHLAAARVLDRRAVINNSLYWATTTSASEGHFLCAILNSAQVTLLARPKMSYGKDERHFDNVVWQLPWPAFDPSIQLHSDIATLGEELERQIADFSVRDTHFAAVRRELRKFIAESNAGKEVEKLVPKLLRAEAGSGKKAAK